MKAAIPLLRTILAVAFLFLSAAGLAVVVVVLAKRLGTGGGSELSPPFGFLAL